jgi:hypothetical protein
MTGPMLTLGLWAVWGCVDRPEATPTKATPAVVAPAEVTPAPTSPGEDGDWASLTLDAMKVSNLSGALGEARFEVLDADYHRFPEALQAQLVPLGWTLAKEQQKEDMRVWTFTRGDQRWEIGLLRLPGMPNARGSATWATSATLPAWAALNPPPALATVCRPIACSFTYASGSTTPVWEAWSRALDAASYTLVASVGTSEERRRDAERLDLTLVEGPEGLLVTVMICVDDGAGGCAPRPLTRAPSGG